MILVGPGRLVGSMGIAVGYVGGNYHRVWGGGGGGGAERGYEGYRRCM